MKVLWLCNVIIPQIQKVIHQKMENGGGWLVNTFEQLLEKGITLAYCAPLKGRKKITKIVYKDAVFYGFKKEKWEAHKYDQSLEKTFRVILNEFQPDIVHIFGTEFPHTLAMVRSFNNPEKTVIHIQGLTVFWGKVYRAFLPTKVYYGVTIHDIIRHDTIALQKKKFDQRGKYEILALKGVKNVMGRTEFDQAAIKTLNPFLKYYYCPENLRKEFIEEQRQWKKETCDRHTVFMSQGTYPIKGLHLALEAMHQLLERYPDTVLYVAGQDIFTFDRKMKLLRTSSYAEYIRKLLKQWKMQKNVVFLGELSAGKMKERYLKSHVYILPSVIENSPNSLCEAMKLGVPSIAADAGGVSSILKHETEGYLYPVDSPYMLAHYIEKIFKDDQLAQKISEHAKMRMDKMMNVKKNISILLQVYKDIDKCSKV